MNYTDIREVVKTIDLAQSLMLEAPADPLRHTLNVSSGVCALMF